MVLRVIITASSISLTSLLNLPVKLVHLSVEPDPVSICITLAYLSTLLHEPRQIVLTTQVTLLLSQVPSEQPVLKIQREQKSMLLLHPLVQERDKDRFLNRAFLLVIAGAHRFLLACYFVSGVLKQLRPYALLALVFMSNLAQGHIKVFELYKVLVRDIKLFPGFQFYFFGFFSQKCCFNFQ